MHPNWNKLSSIAAVHDIIEASHQSPQLIFKHSIRCNLSGSIQHHLEQWYHPEKPLTFYYLDLIKYREVSDFIEQHFDILHESPQVILLVGGEPVFNTSHFRIKGELLDQVVADHSLLS
jgi:bacillithiol system protein YtxJ